MAQKEYQITPEELIGPLNDLEEKFAPKTIFVQGNRDFIQQHPRISIIGTRHPTKEGVATAQKITSFLVKQNVTIISGLAAGIDTVAHTTAIAQGGKTIGVLGTPLNQYYPRENKELQDEIANKHLLISEFPLETPIQKGNFPQRNRTMALISHASLIIEAGKTSGTQHQGWEALRLGRPLFIMEALINNPNLEWPKKLVEYGAQPLSLDNLKPLIEILEEAQMVVQDAFMY